MDAAYEYFVSHKIAKLKNINVYLPRLTTVIAFFIKAGHASSPQAS